MKRKVLALVLSLAMVFSMVPAANLQAAEINAGDVSEDIAEPAVAAEAEEDLGTNVALNAQASAAHTNIYGNVSTKCINDGQMAGGNAATSWNCWGAEANLYPMPVTLTWKTMHSLSAMRVMWWAYNDGGVIFPSAAEVQYLDADGETWHKISDVGLEHGDVDGKDGVWNTLKFDQEVTTTALRLLISRTAPENNQAAGVGISEWEVFGTEKADILVGASITGDSGMAIGASKEYTGNVEPAAMASSVSYEWSVSPAGIVSVKGAANTSKVTLEGLKAGSATLKLKVTKDGVSKEVEKPVRVEGVQSIDTYKTSTATGVAPILPNSVVAKGVTFDTPTPSLKSSTNPNFDFGEEFNDSLVPVTWEKVDPASYAASQVGKTFTVKGKASYDGKEYDAAAEITVAAATNAADTNSSVTFENIQLNDNFWAPKQDTNAITSLNKAILEIGKASGGEPNFDNAIKRLNGEAYDAFKGFVFQDSDIYKSIEAISYTLSATQNETSEEMTAQRRKLEDTLNRWIEKIEKVQYADGYIDTHFTLRSETYDGGEAPGTHRWKSFANHEMYNAGHFLEGVVAYTRYREGINKPDYRLYVAGKRFADEIVALFGPKGTRHEVPGHEEIELALVKFGKLAEQYEGVGAGQKYYDTAQTLIDRRGEDRNLRESGYKGNNYSQDLTPFVNAQNAVGHSVRANYFYTGIADVATMMEDTNPTRVAYLQSLDRIWEAVSNRKTYITGGIGTTTASSDSEGYGDDYDLPNDGSYCEICAAIAAANWNQRMNLLYEDGKYADMVERNLYNSILVGTNLDGNRYYYSTLLEVKSGSWRSEWFACACCPPNLMRTVAALSGYMYTVHKDNLFVNMFVGSEGSVEIGGTKVGLKQETDYPWNGAVKLTVNPEQSKAFTMKVRIPGWVQEQSNKNVTIKVNGNTVSAAAEKGYATITRTWAKGDVVAIDMPMEIRKTEADPNIVTNKGRVALQRGPIVYCMEKAGNAQLNEDIENFDPLKIVIPRDAKLKATYSKDLLKGVVEITGEAKYSLYGELLPIKIQAVPYYAWNNRGDDGVYVPGQEEPKNGSSGMLIWTMADQAIEGAAVASADDAGPKAKISADKTYSGARIEGVHDPSFEPSSSTLGNGLGWSNWTVPRDDTPHWLMYEWDEEITTQQMQVYWFENFPWDRFPGSLKIQYKDANGEWQDAVMHQEYKDLVALHQYNVIDIDQITTKAVRLLMTVNLEDERTQSIGVYRWKVMLDGDAVANNVVNMIESIGTVTPSLACRKAIYDAREAYKSLTEELKAKVTNYAKLEAAEAAYPTLLKEAAAPVETVIGKIGAVQATAASKKLIDDARAAYEALPRNQKAAVGNYSVLLAAEEAFEAFGLDMAASDKVVGLIKAIGTVQYTSASKKLIDAARKAYDALSANDKNFVSNYNVLTAAEKRYAQLQAQQPVDISKAKVASISNQTFSGKEKKPSVKVTYNGKTLVKAKDYKVAYSSNKNIGTAKVTITGIGSYKGKVTKTFKIIVKKNASYTVGNYRYKITNANISGKGTVALTGVKSSSVKKKLKSITVSDSIKIGGKTFKVTEVGKSAFSSCAKATSAKIGKNVKKIGEKAFYNCKKLKKITVTATGLKSVGKNALRNIYKKAVINVPKSKLKAYKKVFKSKGQKSTVKVK